MNQLPPPSFTYALDAVKTRRMRQYRMYGVSLTVLAICEEVPLWKVQEICGGTILASEFATPPVREENEFVTDTGRAAED